MGLTWQSNLVEGEAALICFLLDNRGGGRSCYSHQYVSGWLSAIPQINCNLEADSFFPSERSPTGLHVQKRSDPLARFLIKFVARGLLSFLLM